MVECTFLWRIISKMCARIQDSKSQDYFENSDSRPRREYQQLEA